MSSRASPEALKSDATSFFRFSSLPAEIRDLIWQAAAFPRIVNLVLAVEAEHKCSRVWSQTPIEGPESMGFFDLDHQRGEFRRAQGPMPPYGFRSYSMPALLTTCKESLGVARSIYTKSFGSATRAPVTWFNFEVDTLLISQHTFNHLGSAEEVQWIDVDEEEPYWTVSPDDMSEDVKKVQHVAFCQNLDLIEHVGAFIHDVLSHLGNVKTVTLSPLIHKEDRNLNLAYLEYTDVNPIPGPLTDIDDLHPQLGLAFPAWTDYHTCHVQGRFWSNPELLWNGRSSSFYIANNYRQMPEESVNGQPPWPMPCLQFKPILGQQRRLEYLRDRQQYDRDQDSQSAVVT
ncbi:hypothetical protein VTL71DRAFT_13334 [Oculimacula yallundae]|uniref:2EXR domain-containing protein n=1 Tax=Oculimacula yallundae TaxID=86028 RepID=A0ABR4CK18_9HELO